MRMAKKEATAMNRRQAMRLVLDGLMVVSLVVPIVEAQTDDRQGRQRIILRSEVETRRDLPLSAPLPKDHKDAKLDSWQGDGSDVLAPLSVPGAAAGDPQAQAEVGIDLKSRREFMVLRGADGLEINPVAEGEDLNEQVYPPSLGPDNNLATIYRSGDIGVFAGGIPLEGSYASSPPTLIFNTTAFPYRAMARLIVRFPSNSVPRICTGTLIAAKYVLTSGYCVHDKFGGGWARSIEVIPGSNGSYKPFGSAYAANLRSYKAWTDYNDANYDIALITLDRSIGDSTGWFGYSSRFPFPSKVTNCSGNTCQYNYTVDFFRLSGYSTVVLSTQSGLYQTLVSDYGRSSNRISIGDAHINPWDYRGGPLWLSDHRVYAVYSDSGRAVAITPTIFNNIQSWISSGR